MKKTLKSLVSLAIAAMVLTMAQLNAFADTGVTTARLFGSDRIGTAVAVADAGWTTADTAILAPSADANLVDALAAAPLAGKTAPILLTDNNTLSVATQAELSKLGVKNVYVVGAISQTVVDQINAMVGVTATVLKGADRIGTAVAISSKLTAPAGSFVVGYGALADALSVASYAAANNYSILVANPDGSLPASEAAYKGANVYIIGGPTLVADISGATRIFGADRFATNQKIINTLTYKYDKIYVANGTDAHLVDSLVASSLAAESGASIVLGDTTSAAGAVSVHGKLATNAIVTALGGITVVHDADVEQVTSKTPVLSLPGGIASTLPFGTVGTAYTSRISATGGTPPYSYVASGLPEGLTLGADGTISGIPIQTIPTGFGGSTDIFTVSVTDSAIPTARTVSQNFNITILQAATGALIIERDKLPQPFAVVGTPYSSVYIGVLGGTSPYSLVLASGSTLPAGLTLGTDGGFYGMNGIISGTPTASGTTSFTVNATDSSKPTARTASQTFSFTVFPALSLPSATLADGTVGTAYTASVKATGGIPPSYSYALASGSPLPAGLTLGADGTINGTPRASGTTSFKVNVTDSLTVGESTARTASQTFTITVN